MEGLPDPMTAWLRLLPRGAAALYCLRSLQSTGPLHHPGTGMASSRSGACLMMRRRRMIHCWPRSGFAGCPAWRSVTAACPASGLTGPTCASSVTCGRNPGPAGGFLRYAWHPERQAWPLLQNELLASGLYRYALSRDGVPVKQHRAQAAARTPPGTVTWRPSQPTVTPAVPAHPTQARRTLTTEGSPFPGGQIHRRRPKVCGGCTKPHARIPRPRTRVKERKGRGIHAFARWLLA
jgi:hypothetical protein